MTRATYAFDRRYQNNCKNSESNNFPILLSETSSEHATVTHSSVSHSSFSHDSVNPSMINSTLNSFPHVSDYNNNGFFPRPSMQPNYPQLHCTVFDGFNHFSAHQSSNLQFAEHNNNNNNNNNNNSNNNNNNNNNDSGCGITYDNEPVKTSFNTNRSLDNTQNVEMEGQTSSNLFTLYNDDFELNNQLLYGQTGEEFGEDNNALGHLTLSTHGYMGHSNGSDCNIIGNNNIEDIDMNPDTPSHVDLPVDTNNYKDDDDLVNNNDINSVTESETNGDNAIVVGEDHASGFFPMRHLGIYKRSDDAFLPTYQGSDPDSFGGVYEFYNDGPSENNSLLNLPLSTVGNSQPQTKPQVESLDKSQNSSEISATGSETIAGNSLQQQQYHPSYQQQQQFQQPKKRHEKIKNKRKTTKSNARKQERKHRMLQRQLPFFSVDDNLLEKRRLRVQKQSESETNYDEPLNSYGGIVPLFDGSMLRKHIDYKDEENHPRQQFANEFTGLSRMFQENTNHQHHRSNSNDNSNDSNTTINNNSNNEGTSHRMSDFDFEGISQLFQETNQHQQQQQQYSFVQSHNQSQLHSSVFQYHPSKEQHSQQQYQGLHSYPNNNDGGLLTSTPQFPTTNSKNNGVIDSQSDPPASLILTNGLPPLDSDLDLDLDHTRSHSLSLSSQPSLGIEEGDRIGSSTSHICNIPGLPPLDSYTPVNDNLDLDANLIDETDPYEGVAQMFSKHNQIGINNNNTANSNLGSFVDNKKSDVDGDGRKQIKNQTPGGAMIHQFSMVSNKSSDSRTSTKSTPSTSTLASTLASSVSSCKTSKTKRSSLSNTTSTGAKKSNRSAEELEKRNFAEKERRFQLQQSYDSLQALLPNEAIPISLVGGAMLRNDNSKIRTIKGATSYIGEIKSRESQLLAKKERELERLISLQLRLMELQSIIFHL